MTAPASPRLQVADSVAVIAQAALDWLDEPAVLLVGGTVVVVGALLALRFAVRRMIERALRRMPWGS